MTREPMTPTTPETPTTMDRARDLAELGDYVRTLADRMGLEGWTFAVEHAVPFDARLHDVSRIYCDIEPDRKAGVLTVTNGFFDSTPEARRLEVMRKLVLCHLDEAWSLSNQMDGEEDDHEGFSDLMESGLSAIAAAWAPCLPLPLVGWMRRAGGEKGGGEQ